MCRRYPAELGGAPTGSEGIGALFYLWTPATGLKQRYGGPSTVVPLSVTTHCSGDDEQGCTAAATAEVTVSPGLSVSLVQAGRQSARHCRCRYLFLVPERYPVGQWNGSVLPAGRTVTIVMIATDSLGCKAISADFNFYPDERYRAVVGGHIRVYPIRLNKPLPSTSDNRRHGFSLRVLDTDRSGLPSSPCKKVQKPKWICRTAS